MRTSWKLFFPNSLKHPTLVHCADVCWGAGRGRGLLCSGQVTCKGGGHSRCQPLETHCTKICGQVCGRPVMGLLLSVKVLFSWGRGSIFIRTLVLYYYYYYLLLHQRLKGGGKSPKSTSLDFLICRLKKLSGNWLPSPQNLPKLPKG